jgi:hypothetical protein
MSDLATFMASKYPKMKSVGSTEHIEVKETEQEKKDHTNEEQDKTMILLGLFTLLFFILSIPSVYTFVGKTAKLGDNLDVLPKYLNINMVLLHTFVFFLLAFIILKTV